MNKDGCVKYQDLQALIELKNEQKRKIDEDIDHLMSVMRMLDDVAPQECVADELKPSDSIYVKTESDVLPTTFSGRLSVAMKAYDSNHQEMSKKLGVSCATLRNWLHGAVPKKNTDEVISRLDMYFPERKYGFMDYWSNAMKRGA